MGCVSRNIVASVKRFMPTIASKVRPGSELGKVIVSQLMLTNAFSSTTVNQFQFEYPKTTRAVSKTQAATSTDHGKNDIENEPEDVRSKDKARKIRSRNSRKNFTPKEDKFILDYVEKFGDKQSTFQALCEQLDRKHYYNIKRRYMRLTQETDLSVIDLDITKYARFTKAEDEIILEYVREYGYHTQVFKILSPKLKSRYWQVIQRRYSRIISDSIEKPKRKFRQEPRTCKPWTLEEDEQLIKFLLKVMNYYANIIITCDTFQKHTLDFR